MKNSALLIVDVQKALIAEHPYHERKLLQNIRRLIDLCRENDTEVIYVRHDSGEDDELGYGSDGWQIADEISPAKGEKIFDKKYNSAFKETELKEYLDSKQITNLILVGMQTEYCIDTSCKVAFEYGYHLIMPEGTTSTYDTPFASAEALNDYYVNTIWKDRFAKVLPINEVEKKITEAETALD